MSTVTRLEWEACDAHNCHCEIVESKDGDMVNYEDYVALEKKLTDMAVQLANAESKCRVLVAENAGMKAEVPLGAIENGRAFAERLETYSFECQGGNLNMCSDWQELRRCFEHLSEWAMHSQEETPATDAFLAEVRAQGVWMLKDHINKWMLDMSFPSDMQFEHAEFIQACDEFAAQLRKGAAL